MMKAQAVIMSGSIRVLRAVLGSVLIFSVLAVEHSPEWLAILATYPIFTAILARDPLYSAVSGLRALWHSARDNFRDNAIVSGTHAAT